MNSRLNWSMSWIDIRIIMSRGTEVEVEVVVRARIEAWVCLDFHQELRLVPESRWE